MVRPAAVAVPAGMSIPHVAAPRGPSYGTERRLLQAVIAVGAVVPVGGGFLGMVEGAAMYGEAAHLPALDSHVRYLSGLLVGIGLLFWSAVPAIERRGRLVRSLAFVVVIGGLARAAAALRAGVPDAATALALAMELGVTPLIALWQWRLAGRPTETEVRPTA